MFSIRAVNLIHFPKNISMNFLKTTFFRISSERFKHLAQEIARALPGEFIRIILHILLKKMEKH